MDLVPSNVKSFSITGMVAERLAEFSVDRRAIGMCLAFLHRPTTKLSLTRSTVNPACGREGIVSESVVVGKW